MQSIAPSDKAVANRPRQRRYARGRLAVPSHPALLARRPAACCDHKNGLCSQRTRVKRSSGFGLVAQDKNRLFTTFMALVPADKPKYLFMVVYPARPGRRLAGQLAGRSRHLTQRLDQLCDRRARQAVPLQPPDAGSPGGRNAPAWATYACQPARPPALRVGRAVAPGGGPARLAACRHGV